MTTNAIKPLGPVPPMAQTYRLGPTCREPDGPIYVVALAHAVELRSYTEDCMARLRVAVGVLKGIANGANGDHDPVCEEDSLTYKEIEDFACKALATIGPIPPTERSKETI